MLAPIIVTVIVNIPFHIIRRFTRLAYVGGTFLVLFTWVTNGAEGVKAWTDVIWGYTIQPSEFIKLAMILLLAQELAKVDPESAARLHPNDEKRIVRALEVYLTTGKTITQHNAETQAIPPRYDALTLNLSYENREDMWGRIDRRVDVMMEQGLVEEVRALLSSGVPDKCTAMQAIGYKEMVQAVRVTGDYKAGAEEIKLRSRQYAKRQLTWFKRNAAAKQIVWGSNPDLLWAVRRSTEFMEEFGI
jgi:tRNA dimethylallyltransferase